MRLVYGFHFNQPYSPYLRIVIQYSYIPLIRMLLNKNIRATLCISGVTARAMLDLASGRKFYELLKVGVERKLFSLLGTTYAAEIPAALGREQFLNSVIRHRKLMELLFGISPETFWVSERIYSPDLFADYKELGFKRTFIEQQNLKPSLRHRCLRDSNGMTCLEDSRIMKWKINEWMRNGCQLPLRSYLMKKRYKGIYSYIEDAEAFRVWNMEERKRNRVTDFENMLSLLSFLGKLKICHPEEIMPESKTLAHGRPGQSFWIKNSFERLSVPRFYENEPYKNWFDFQKRSPDLQYFRQTGKQARLMLLEIRELTGEKISGLYEHALEIYYSGRFELGCPGVMRKGSERFEYLPKLRLIRDISRIFNNGETGFFTGDYTGSGKKEFLFISTTYAAVISEKAEIIWLISFSPFLIKSGNLLFSSLSGPLESRTSTINLKKDLDFLSFRKEKKVYRPGTFQILEKQAELFFENRFENRLSFRGRYSSIEFELFTESIKMNVETSQFLSVIDMAGIGKINTLSGPYVNDSMSAIQTLPGGRYEIFIDINGSNTGSDSAV